MAVPLVFLAAVTTLIGVDIAVKLSIENEQRPIHCKDSNYTYPSKLALYSENSTLCLAKRSIERIVENSLALIYEIDTA